MADTELEAVADGGDEKPAGKHKLVLIIAAFAVVLVGGGLAAYFFLSGEADGEGSKGFVAEPELQGPPVYHKMDPVFVVNFPPGGKAKMLQVGLEVFTHDPAVGEILERHKPMLRHHLLDILSNQQADALYSRAGRQALQATLQQDLQARLAALSEDQPRIEALYFTQFVMQ
jgi:flagellar FliL protein